MEEIRILIVDDDARMCRMLKRYLTEEGYLVHVAENASQMYECLLATRVNLILLDLNLPDAHGLQLAIEIRAKYERIGIIILTGRLDTVDKVVGLEVGADDYMVKPFEERELLARIRSVLRRTMFTESAAGSSVATFLNYKIDLDAHQLITVEGELIDLTTHQFMLLSFFIRNFNKVLSRDQIMDEISGKDWAPSDRSVDVLIGKLRKKIEADVSRPEMITTIRGIGYKFTARVTFQ